MSLHAANSVGQCVLAFNEISNAKPSFGQLVPNHHILWTACDFGHGLALSGKLRKRSEAFIATPGGRTLLER